VALATLSLLVPSTLTYDSFTWANWAREIVHLHLDTRTGPAWKPLPVLLDLPFARLGAAMPWTWLIIARAGGLLAVVMSFRLARRMGGWGAGLFAAIALTVSTSFVYYFLAVGLSEPLMAGLALLAVERHLDRRYGQAAALVYGCILLRPEYVPFLLGYSALVWRRLPRARVWLVAGVLVLPALFFLPDYVGSGDWLRSARRAAIPSEGGARLTGDPGLATLEAAGRQVIVPVLVGAGLAVVLAVRSFWKRGEDGVLLGLIGLSAGVLLWEAALTQAGKGAGNARYLIVGYSLACVIAGVGWSRAVAVMARVWPSRRVAVRTATVVVVVGIAAFVGFEAAGYPRATHGMYYQVHKDGQLRAVISRIGRSRLLQCGPVMADTYQVAALAWDLDVPISRITVIAPPPGGVPRGRGPDASRFEATPLPWALPTLEKTGTLFRTSTFGGEMPMTPAPPKPTSPFRVIARTSQWQVWSTCSGDKVLSEDSARKPPRRGCIAVVTSGLPVGGRDYGKSRVILALRILTGLSMRPVGCMGHDEDFPKLEGVGSARPKVQPSTPNIPLFPAQPVPVTNLRWSLRRRPSGWRRELSRNWRVSTSLSRRARTEWAHAWRPNWGSDP
jgi:hypothetical protein